MIWKEIYMEGIHTKKHLNRRDKYGRKTCKDLVKKFAIEIQYTQLQLFIYKEIDYIMMALIKLSHLAWLLICLCTTPLQRIDDNNYGMSYKTGINQM